MHRLACLIVIAACAAHSSIDLDGSIACGPNTCGDGELCLDTVRNGSGGSANPVETFDCVAAPADCELTACSYACSAPPEPSCCPRCVSDLCGYIPRLHGRDLFCQGF